MGRSRSEVVEHLPQHQKVKGSSLGASALTVREKIEIKMLKWIWSFVGAIVEQPTHEPKADGLNSPDTDTWGLYYKTFYGRNLRIFVIS